MKMRYSLIPSRAVGDKELTNGSFRTLSALCLFTSQMGICYPNQCTLADIRGCTQSNIAQQLKLLRELSYVIDLIPQGRKRRDSYKRGNRYYVPTLATDPVPSWEMVRKDYLAETRKPRHGY